MKSKKVRKKKVVLNSALAVIIGGVLMGCSANSESPEKLTKEKEVKKEKESQKRNHEAGRLGIVRPAINF